MVSALSHNIVQAQNKNHPVAWAKGEGEVSDIDCHHLALFGIKRYQLPPPVAPPFE